MAEKTLIIGNGLCALQTAQQLAAEGIEVIVASREAEPDGSENLKAAVSGDAAIEFLNGVRLDAFSGFVGQFEARLHDGKQTNHRTAGSIVIAEDSRRVPNVELYGLPSTDRVMALSRFQQLLEKTPAELTGQKIAFLNGLYQESSAVITADVLHCALGLQSLNGAQGYFLTANLKVAGNGLEKRYRAAKAAGCLFFKFSDTKPIIHNNRKEGISIDFVDEVNGDCYSLMPDIVVVDETVVPSDYLTHLAELMQLDTDPSGFIQTDNVHRLTVSTNRRGIFAAGPARAEMMQNDMAIDAANAAAEIIALRKDEMDVPLYRAEVDTGQCIACLTCLRLCPYKAVLKGHRMKVMTDACEGCGICAAECPRGAISMDKLGVAVDHQISLLAAEKRRSDAPAIVSFCCSRSAHRAGALATCLGDQLPAGLTTVVVPCAGGIAIQHILAAFRGGADGVLVMTCHEGNCHSEKGNQYARAKVEMLSDQLPQLGISSNRLEIHTLASNMAREFVDITGQFEKKLKEIAE